MELSAVYNLFVKFISLFLWSLTTEYEATLSQRAVLYETRCFYALLLLKLQAHCY
jgi:hypothetical protein